MHYRLPLFSMATSSIGAAAMTPFAIAGLFASVFGAIAFWEQLEDQYAGDDLSLDPSSPYYSSMLEPNKQETAVQTQEDMETTDRGVSDVELKKAVRDVEGQLKGTRTRCTTLERERERYKGKVKSLEEQLLRSREEQGRLRGIVREKASELGIVRREVAALRRTSGFGEDLGVKLKEQLERADQFKSQLKRVSDIHEESNHRLVAELEESQVEVKRQSLLIGSLQESLESAVDQAKRKSRVVDELEGELDQLRKEVKEYESKWVVVVGTVGEDLASTKKVLEARDEEIRVLREQHGEMERRVSQATEEMAQLRSSLVAAKAREEDLKSKLSGLEDSQGLREVLEEVRHALEDQKSTPAHHRSRLSLLVESVRHRVEKW